MESNYNFLNYFEKAEFDYLTIIIINFDKTNSIFSINKKTHSIELDLKYFNLNNIKFLNELKKYESVTINIYFFSEDFDKDFNLIIFDEESKIKHFKLNIQSSDYYLDFPINYEKIISLDLTYKLIPHIKFPLTEKVCKYIFPSLKNLRLNFFYHCEMCVDDFSKELIPYLSNNLKFCPSLENLEIDYKLFKSKFNELKFVLEGIKCLKNLKQIYLNNKNKESYIITKDEFYKYYPEYIDYCPFLNDIKIKIPEIYVYDFLIEEKLNYKINDIVIKDYLYIKTLGIKSSYFTYLCKSKNNKKVVIRKFKKNCINNAPELFENEKYCLEKFKNNPNVIKYIEFLSDEHCEYIIYEYIDNAIKYFKSKYIAYKVRCFLRNFFKYHLKKDNKMILLPIYPNNILIKKNFDMILLGFGYLNLYNNNTNYTDVGEYLKNNLVFNEKYFDYIYKLLSIDYGGGFGIESTKKNDNLKMDKQIKLDKEIIIGKIIPIKEYIITLQNNSLIIYSKINLNMVTNMIFPEEEEDLLNIKIIDTNFMIVLSKYKIYTVSFNNNNLNIIDVIENNYLQEKYNINLINNDTKENIFFNEITYIEKIDIIFLSGNVISSWKYDKNEKKIKIIKFYENLNYYTIFKIKNNDIPLIAIDEKLIFYNIDDKIDLISLFDYKFDYPDYQYETNKIFFQDGKYCYVLMLGCVFIFTINYKKKKINCLFQKSIFIHDRYNDGYFPKNRINCIYPFKNGLLIGSNVPFLLYLIKTNDNYYKVIEYLIYLENEEIFDINKEENNLFIIGNNNIQIFEIKN